MWAARRMVVMLSKMHHIMERHSVVSGHKTAHNLCSVIIESIQMQSSETKTDYLRKMYMYSFLELSKSTSRAVRSKSCLEQFSSWLGKLYQLRKFPNTSQIVYLKKSIYLSVMSDINNASSFCSNYPLRIVWKTILCLVGNKQFMIRPVRIDSQLTNQSEQLSWLTDSEQLFVK